MLVLGKMCLWVLRMKKVLASAFDFHASDNISSPVGTQFIWVSGAPVNGILQAIVLGSVASVHRLTTPQIHITTVLYMNVC